MSGTDFTVTPNYSLYKPIYNADDEAWGDHWNFNADVIDSQMKANAVAVGNYLPLTGGTLSGPLQLPNGTMAVPSLALGAADGTGFSRTANALVFGVQNSMVLAMFAGSAQFYASLGMLNNPITQLADAVNPGDALNMRSGDARYLPLSGGTLTGPLTAPTMTVQPGWSCCFATNLYPTDDQGSFNYLQDGFAAFLQQDPDFGGVSLTLFPNDVADASISYATGNFSFGQDGSFAATGGFYGTSDRGLGVYDDGSGNRFFQFKTGFAWFYSIPNNGPLQWLANGNPVFSIDAAGNVTASGNIAAAGNVWGPQGVFANSDSTLSLRDAGAHRYLSFGSNWYWDWNTSNGLLSWLANGSSRFTIDAAGNVIASGTVTGLGGLCANGDSSLVFYDGGSNRYLQFAVDWYWDWNYSNGVLTWTTNSGGVFSIDAAGNALAHGNISGGGTIYGAQGVYANADSTLALHDAGATRNLSFSSASEWSWNATTASLTWLVGGLSAFSIDINGNVVAHGSITGNGAYVNVSDERMKQDIEPATVGLNEVLALMPINFTRASMMAPDSPATLPTPRVEIGFSAQQVGQVIPEAVQTVMVERPDGGGMTDDDPTLGVQNDPIMAALVNAVKTLDARLQAVEAMAVP